MRCRGQDTIDSFLTDMERETDDILVISRDGLIRLMMCSILGLPVWIRYNFKITMAGISAIEYDGVEWRISRFNRSPERSGRQGQRDLPDGHPLSDVALMTALSGSGYNSLCNNI